MNNILTCGVFDLIHSGHIKFLNKIKSENGKLIVLIHSDRFVASYKKNRPIINENDRLLMIQSLKIVDECFISDDDYIVL
jgi:cytidyltransferase-like protein